MAGPMFRGGFQGILKNQGIVLARPTNPQIPEGSYLVIPMYGQYRFLDLFPVDSLADSVIEAKKRKSSVVLRLPRDIVDFLGFEDGTSMNVQGLWDHFRISRESDVKEYLSKNPFTKRDAMALVKYGV